MEDAHEKSLLNYQKKLQRKINLIFREHYPYGKFYKNTHGFFCLKTNKPLDQEAMDFLYINGYVRLHFGTCFNFSYYILDTIPHGLTD